MFSGLKEEYEHESTQKRKEKLEQLQHEIKATIEKKADELVWEIRLRYELYVNRDEDIKLIINSLAKEEFFAEKIHYMNRHDYTLRIYSPKHPDSPFNRNNKLPHEDQGQLGTGTANTGTASTSATKGHGTFDRRDQIEPSEKKSSQHHKRHGRCSMM